MSKKEISFTEGPVFQSLLRFAIPVLGALILQAAYGAVDLLIVGKFGNASSISAVGTGSSFMQMATFIITSLAMGSTVIIGHHIGEQKPKEAGNAVGTTIILFLIIAVIMTFVLELPPEELRIFYRHRLNPLTKRFFISESVLPVSLLSLHTM